MGRRKIEIQPITHERNRSVTFLKRKNGLFKKAYELGVLCSVDVAVIVFEDRPGHGKKLYQYCSGDIQHLLKRHARFEGEKDLRGPGDFSGSGGGASGGMKDEDDEEEEEEDVPPPPPSSAGSRGTKRRASSSATTKGKSTNNTSGNGNINGGYASPTDSDYSPPHNEQRSLTIPPPPIPTLERELKRPRVVVPPSHHHHSHHEPRPSSSSGYPSPYPEPHSRDFGPSTFSPFFGNSFERRGGFNGPPPYLMQQNTRQPDPFAYDRLANGGGGAFDWPIHGGGGGGGGNNGSGFIPPGPPPTPSSNNSMAWFDHFLSSAGGNSGQPTSASESWERGGRRNIE